MSTPAYHVRESRSWSAAFTRDVRAAFAMLVAPRATLRDFGARDPVLGAWLVVSLLSIVLTFLTISVMQRATVHLLAGTDSPAMQAAAAESLHRMKFASTAMAPVAVALRLLAIAAALWAPACVAGSTAGYRTFLSLAAYAAMPEVLEKAMDLGVTWFSGPEFTHGLVPTLVASTSLTAIFPDLDASPWVEAALAHTTVFSLWVVALWAVGLRERCRLAWGFAGTIAAGAWCFFLALACASDVLNASMTRSLSSMP